MSESRTRRQDRTSGSQRRIAATLFLAAIIAGVALTQSTAASGNRSARNGMSGSRDPWGALHRTLHIPKISTGARCPRTQGGSAAPRVGFTLGTGPAYPVLGTSAPGGVVTLGDDLRRGGWYLHKTIWAVSIRYRGPVLVRGSRVDGTSPVRFGFARRLYLPREELRINSASRRGWRLAGSYTFLRTPGCYAFQTDGLTFSKVILFEVSNG
jgi:hypothetical protein